MTFTRTTFHPCGLIETAYIGPRTTLRSFYGTAEAVDAMVESIRQSVGGYVTLPRNRQPDGRYVRDILVQNQDSRAGSTTSSQTPV